LGLSTCQTFKATEPDTLVSVVIKSGCPIPTVHIVEINSKVTAETQTKFVCIDKPFQLIIKSGWQKVEWKWEQSTSSKDTIKIKTGKDLVVNVKASTGSCSYEKTINLHLSKPKLVLTDNNFKIKKGESVTLQASGAKTYNWNPPTGLSSPIVPNPTATPLASIIYQLIAADSIGCEVKDSVTIVVEETSFIPTLFTPNGDGKNDELKLFGLSAGNNFTFEIYNREGSIVYESTDIQLATSVGWNGSTRGIPQPAGIYYWKIEGTQPNGMPLTLNGKTKGSVLLVR
jgi:gliding motility-associated-like protein